MRRSAASSSSAIASTLALAGLLSGPLPGFAAEAEPGPGARRPAELVRLAAAAPLQPERAVRARNVRLRLGPASVLIEDAVIVPAAGVAERPVEFAIVGAARLIVAPPDEIEAGQLELFTGKRSLDEPFTSAALVACSDSVADLLMRQPSAGPLDAATAESAGAALARWRACSERRTLAIDAEIALDALGDAYHEPFSAGWFRTSEQAEHRDLLLVVDPDATEQVTLGRFVKLDLTEAETRRAKKTLHGYQRQGRLMGATLDELGTMDTWLSASLRDAAGAPRSGVPPFHEVHHVIEASLDHRTQRIQGRARMQLKATHSGARAIRLQLYRELAIDTIEAEDGTPLDFHRQGHQVVVFLPSTVAGGATIPLDITWSGPILEKVQRGVLAVSSTQAWHPRVASDERATYDVRLSWPDGIDVVAAGRLVEEGRGTDGGRWQRRAIEAPSLGFGFEMGRFEIVQRQQGHVAITLAFDKSVAGTSAEQKTAISDAVADSLAYFEEKLGPHPLDHLVVVTVPRGFSQGMLGFISLSSIHVFESGLVGALLGIEDPRTVVAHEMAHQWFGNQVGWASYRDEWLSEGMATYLAWQWASTRLPEDKRPAVGPLADWQSALESTDAKGRPIESYGPLVLGRRLTSSLSDDAFSAIVYRKGGVVLNMLSKFLEEERFLEFLRDLVRASEGRRLTTDAFLAAVRSASGADLDWFETQYVEGTGMPVVFYSSSNERGSDGKWIVKGVAERRALHLEPKLRVVALPDGRLDCRRIPSERRDSAAAALVVPFSIGVHDPAQVARAPGGKAEKPARRKDADAGKKDASAWVGGRMLLATERFEFDIAVDHEPVAFRLDPRREIFGRFVSRDQSPRVALVTEASALADAGRAEDAVALLSKALDADLGESPVAFSKLPPAVAASMRERMGAALTAQIRLEMAELQLDLGHVADATASLAQARSSVDGMTRQLIEERLEVLEARRDLLAGNAAEALRRLKPRAKGADRLESARGWAFLSLAARAASDAPLLDLALKEARERGVDVSAME